MTYDAVVTTNEGKHTYKNIEAVNEQHLTNKIHKDLDDEIIYIDITKTFGEEFNQEAWHKNEQTANRNRVRRDSGR